MDNRPTSPQPSSVGMDKPNASSASTAILWITFVVALGVTLFLFMASRSAANAVAEKESDKNDITTELASPSYVAIEEKANSFKEAFTILSELSTNRLPKKDVMDALYRNFTKDVMVKNLSLSSGGELTVDGATSSYRAAADFIVGLRNYNKISDLRLSTVGVSATEGAPANQKIVFTVKGKLNIVKDQPVATDTDSISSPGALQSGSE